MAPVTILKWFHDGFCISFRYFWYCLSRSRIHQATPVSLIRPDPSKKKRLSMICLSWFTLVLLCSKCVFELLLAPCWHPFGIFSMLFAIVVWWSFGIGFYRFVWKVRPSCARTLLFSNRLICSLLCPTRVFWEAPWLGLPPIGFHFWLSW